MNPEQAEVFDAARDAIALLDAALRGDGQATHLLVSQWSSRGEVLLEQLLSTAAGLCRNIASLTGTDPHEVVATLRRATADAERMLSDE